MRNCSILFKVSKHRRNLHSTRQWFHWKPCARRCINNSKSRLPKSNQFSYNRWHQRNTSNRQCIPIHLWYKNRRRASTTIYRLCKPIRLVSKRRRNLHSSRQWFHWKPCVRRCINNSKNHSPKSNLFSYNRSHQRNTSTRQCIPNRL